MAESVLNQTEEKIAQNTSTGVRNGSLKRTVGLILAVIMIAVSSYVIILQNDNNRLLSQTNDLFEGSSLAQAGNYRAYVKQYKDTKLALDETIKKLEIVQAQLDQVSAELAEARTMLADTEGLLAQAQTENSRLTNEINELEVLRGAENVQSTPELEGKITALKKKNREVSSELSSVKSELRAFQADFGNIEEGSSLVILFQSKIRLVKSRMKYLRQEAHFARVAAQKEKDRLAFLNGNNGFLLKDGKIKKAEDAKNLAVDVKFMQ